jgi:rhodanese-related sulfurtransferase/uncharacterized membrane protein YedE/YeeE
MTEFPLNMISSLGAAQAFLVYGLIGFAFGFVLESSGFGNSRKLAAQFYFQELTVFKVMFTAIITAMSLVFLTSALGLLDVNLVWVPPTYVWPGIVGGFIMGIGFIVGGFCPGTSLVAAATLKLDGVFFVLGVLFGIFVFGETVDSYEAFFNSSFLGRLTLTESLGIATGPLVLLVVAAALALFVGAEWVEQKVGGIPWRSAPRWRGVAAGALLALAAAGALLGQPDNADRWARIAPLEEQRLASREVFVEPLEVLSLMNDSAVRVQILDLRSEYEFNRFHIRDSLRVDAGDLDALAEQLIALPDNTVFLLAAGGDSMAVAPWRHLRAESVPNLYILAGGIDGWLAQFAADDPLPAQLALGGRHPAADPNPYRFEGSFEPKVEMEIKRAPEGGGCG